MVGITLLSGGAAQGLVHALQGAFTGATGRSIAGTFGAVGAMRAKLEAGQPTDVVILTAAIVRDLAAKGIVLADSVTDIGNVATAIAVRNGSQVPTVANADQLRAALMAADAIYFPDPAQATAGIHFASVLDKLGIAEPVRQRLRTFPNGATAMRALAAAPERNPIGCTQVTEIVATPGVTLVAALPVGFDLMTQYTAGIVAASTNQAAARTLIALLASPENAGIRQAGGFV